MRPHNTFHTTERATCVSQFEAHVRAVCDLPLGDVSLVKPAAIVNLLGDLWLADRPLDVAQMLDVPTLRLHLYEKPSQNRGEKWGICLRWERRPQRRVIACCMHTKS